MTTLLERHQHHKTPDSHDYPTRPYDLVKEFTIALAVVTALSLLLAIVFSSPDDRSITMSRWAQADPADVVATAAADSLGVWLGATAERGVHADVIAISARFQ